MAASATAAPTEFPPAPAGNISLPRHLPAPQLTKNATKSDVRDDGAHGEAKTRGAMTRHVRWRASSLLCDAELPEEELPSELSSSLAVSLLAAGLLLPLLPPTVAPP